MGNKFSLVVFLLLAFSLLLFGCLNQGGPQGVADNRPSGGQVQTGQGQVAAELPPDDISTVAQDVSDLELNESDYQ